MRIGDKVRVKENHKIFAGCEGIIIDKQGIFYIVDLYKGNDKVTEKELEEFSVFFKEDDLEKIIKLDVKRLREEKNTQIISTEESLKDVEIWFNNQMEGE